MRVLITVGFLGHFGETDGVVTTYKNLLPRFVRWGVPVDVVAYGPEDHRETHGDVRLFVHRPRVPWRIDPARWVDVGFAATRLGRELARLPYTLVQSSTPDPLGFWAGGVARRHDTPFVTLYHTALGAYAEIRGRHAAGAVVGRAMRGIMDGLLRNFYDGADLVLAPSECVRAEIAPAMRPPVAVLGRGVDSRAFHPRKRSRTGGRPRALYVGRIAPEKNIEALVPIFAARENVELVLVGDGPSVDELRQALPRATFAGRLTGDGLAAAYADADFFVFPSLTDTLGNVVLEAMASGLPAIVADRMGPKELVHHGGTGFVAHGAAEFAQAVDVLATNADRRAAMGQAARAFAETRSWDAIFAQLLRYYDQALRRRTPAGRIARTVAHAVR
jgi:phosphatidylinositol alpha 1,6-mannosyltransferase